MQAAVKRVVSIQYTCLDFCIITILMVPSMDSKLSVTLCNALGFNPLYIISWNHQPKQHHNDDYQLYV